MMMDLYNQDRILEIHIASEKRIAVEKAAQKAEKKGTRLLKDFFGRGNYRLRRLRNARMFLWGECLTLRLQCCRRFEAP